CAARSSRPTPRRSPGPRERCGSPIPTSSAAATPRGCGRARSSGGDRLGGRDLVVEERPEDLRVAHEEGALVEALAAQPSGDLAVVLARVARGARGDDVLEGVAPAARDGQHAVLLEGTLGRAAVGARAP